MIALDCLDLALRRPSIEPADRRLAGVKLTLSLRCRTPPGLTHCERAHGCGQRASHKDSRGGFPRFHILIRSTSSSVISSPVRS
jgi:hypothetical protein